MLLLISSQEIWRQLFHWQIIHNHIGFETVWIVLFLGFSLGFLFLLFLNNGADVQANTFGLSNLFFLLLLPSHSCKQTGAGKLKRGRQSNPSSISLSWLLIQVPDAPGSSTNSVCVCLSVCWLGRCSTAHTNRGILFGNKARNSWNLWASG